MTFDRIEPVVFLDDEKSNLIIERKEAVEGYVKVVKALDGLALDAEESRRRISEFAA